MTLRIALTGLLAMTAASFASAQTQPQARPEGEALFRRDCAACHTVAPGSGAAEGPSLFGVVGRKIGSMTGFHYSSALSAKSGDDWSAETLDQWLTDTQQFAPGSNMTYFNESERERQSLVLYLKSLGAGLHPAGAISPAESRP